MHLDVKDLAIAVIVLYVLSLLCIFSYSIIQLNLVISYIRNKWKEKKKGVLVPVSGHCPLVTVQLPIYNELYVVERLLDSVALLEYPKDKLEIQVLDDSTDETVEVTAAKVAELQERGFDIQHIRRPNRKGFKAGALAYGLEFAKGEFVAIFDSDFLPKPEFLTLTVPYFEDKHIGAVQTKWEHLNKNYSLLTRLQAFGLDAHFSVEQRGRNSAGHFMNFNGTAGIWRKFCIENAGGWHADTLTEDLDLSYRAQLKAWKFIYLEDVGTPAELPVEMNAFRNQQYRWNKGAAECAKKNLPAVFRKRGMGLKTKMHAVFHLLNSTIFIFVMLTALLSIPMLLIKEEFPQFSWIFFYASFFLMSMVILALYYFTSFAQHEKKFPDNIAEFLTLFPVFLAVSMGMALHNAMAVLQGWAGKKTAFVRTPKFNVLGSVHKPMKKNKYVSDRVNWMTVFEGLLALYFTFGIIIGIKVKDYGLMPFHVMLATGFGLVFYFSVFHHKIGSLLKHG